MLANRRSSERRACRNFAKIQFATGGLPRDCMISDMSDGGVKIIAEYPEIPSGIHGDLLGGPAAPMQAGLADRLRVRRSIPRLRPIGTAPLAGASGDADEAHSRARCPRKVSYYAKSSASLTGT